MKFKTNKNELLKNFKNCIVLSDSYYILSPFEAIAYNSGNFGWNYDVYIINNTCITTGYRTQKSLNTLNYSYDDYMELNSKCKNIYNSMSNKEEAKKEIKKLFIDWLEDIKKQNYKKY